MDTDLFKIIKSQQNLTSDHYKFIMYQILRALLYLHSAKIIHRDIKPSNVLINEDCTIKLCDFGLSRGLEDDSSAGLTEYVVTRFYRAPEVMLCSHNYTKAIDIWSAGCTFGELLSKHYLFPGENYLTQIKLIIELLGSVSDDDLSFILNDNAKNFVMGFKNIPPVIKIFLICFLLIIPNTFIKYFDLLLISIYIYKFIYIMTLMLLLYRKTFQNYLNVMILTP